MASRSSNRLLLGALVATITGLDVLWRVLEQRAPHWDMANHLGDSLVYLRLFSLSHPLPFLQTMISYPPLVNWVTDAFYAATGNEAVWVAVLSNVVWLVILVSGTYGLGKTLAGERAGMVAVAFLVTTPMMVTTFKEYMVDAPLAATVALALMYLVRAREFSDRKQSLLFGVACGLGLLVKWTFPLVLGLPFVQAASAALSDSRKRRTTLPLVNLLGAALCTFAVAGIWYVPNIGKVIYQARDKGYAGAPAGLPAPFSFGSAVWYFWALVDRQLFLVPFVFLIVGAAFYVRRRELARRDRYLILTVIGSYVAFTVLRDKDARFTLPMIPAVAVLATGWLECLASRARRALTALVVVYGAAVFLAISFGLPGPLTNLEVRLGSGPLLGDIPSLGVSKLSVFLQVPYLIGPPTSQNWHQEDAFRALARYPASERKFAYLGPVTIWFNQFGIRYYALRYDALWLDVKHSRFVLIRGRRRPPDVTLTALERWRLPDGEPLTLFRKQ